MKKLAALAVAMVFAAAPALASEPAREYEGRTSQGLIITLARAGGAVTWAVDFEANCGNNSVIVGNEGGSGARIKDNRFNAAGVKQKRHIGAYTLHLDARAMRGSAVGQAIKGVFDIHATVDKGGTHVATCDTGSQAWSASRL